MSSEQAACLASPTCLRLRWEQKPLTEQCVPIPVCTASDPTPCGTPSCDMAKAWPLQPHQIPFSVDEPRPRVCLGLTWLEAVSCLGAWSALLSLASCWPSTSEAA